MKKFNLKIKGISLLEVMLSLAIIAIILVMATRYFAIASFTNKLNQATSQISEVTQAVYRYHNDKGTYPGDIKAIANYLTPQTAVGTAANPWGGDISLGGTLPPDIVFSNLPPKACQALQDRYQLQGGVCNGRSFTVPSSLQQQ